MRPAPVTSPQGMFSSLTPLRLQFCHERNNHLLEQHTWVDTMRLGQAGKVTGQAFSKGGSYSDWHWRVERTTFWQGDIRQMPPRKLRKLRLTHPPPPLS